MADLHSDVPHQVPPRASSSYNSLPSFALDKQRSYKQQYGDMYFCVSQNKACRR